jgi:hypothetical protein
MAADPTIIDSSLLDDVRDLLRESRGKAYAAANLIMIDAYWNIGRRIVEEEQDGRERAGNGQGTGRLRQPAHPQSCPWTG